MRKTEDRAMSVLVLPCGVWLRSMPVRVLLLGVWLCGVLLAGGCGRRVIEVIGTAQDAAVPEEVTQGAAEAAGRAAGRGPAQAAGAVEGAADTQGQTANPGGAAGAQDNAGAEEALLLVYICGAVRRPGVYELPAGARVYQLVEAAGGLLKTADEKALNQARPLADGEQIVVLTAEETAGLAHGAAGGQFGGTAGAADGQFGGMSAGAADANAAGRLININTAEASELMKLKGIGAARAAAIIAYREKNGGFQTIEEIMKVSGIKHSLFEGIRDDITVG